MFANLLIIHLFFSIECRSLGNVIQDTVETPLLLSPYIKSGNIELAQKKSRVVIPGFEDIESYSGFITVNEKYNSNIFFWYFKSKKTTAPLTAWLQGGPGGSSLIGLFYENGPLEVSGNTFTRRKYSWTDMFHMLYIDSPVGTGFSFTDSSDGYTRNQSQITDQLYSFMQQFLTIYPDQRSNDLFLTGESYGCKPVADLSYRIHSRRDSKINLKGLAIGGGFCDPVSQSKYGKFLFDERLINSNTLAKFQDKERQLDAIISRGEYQRATELWSTFWSLIPNINAYNYKVPNAADDADDYTNILNQAKYRSALHVGKARFNNGRLVFNYLSGDFMKSVKSDFPVLFDNYKVLIFNGNLDVICAAPLMDKLIDSIQWRYANNYRNTTKNGLKVGAQTVGHTRGWQNFSRGIVYEAGHLTPHDQPLANYELMKKFVFS